MGIRLVEGFKPPRRARPWKGVDYITLGICIYLAWVAYRFAVAIRTKQPREFRPGHRRT